MRVERCPSLFEPANLIARDGRRRARPLIDVAEALKDERHEEADEDVHADDVPRHEERSSPLRTAAIAVQEVVRGDAVRLSHLRKVFHDGVPTLTAAGPKKQYQSFWDCSKVEVAVLRLAELGEAQRLREGDGVDQEQHEPSREEVTDRRQAGRGRFEELIELIVSWDEKQRNRDQKELVQLIGHPSLDLGKL